MSESHLFWLTQFFGLLATLANCSSFLLKKRSSIMGWQIVSSSLWVAHFLFLGAPTAVIMNLLGLVRQVVFYFRGRSSRIRSGWWPIAFCAAFLLGGYLTWEGWPSAFPTLGMIFGTIAMWQVETKKLRLLSMIPPPLWFTYNTVHLSFAGMFTEVFILISQLTGYFWHETKRSRPPSEESKATPQGSNDPE